MSVDADAAPGVVRHAVLTTLLIIAMTLSMLPLFLLGALGPRLIGEFGGTTTRLGLLVAAGFAVAALLSPVVGPAVAAIGARRCLSVMFVVAATALGLFAMARSYALLVLAIALSGLAQALANPTTNQLIAARIPPSRRGAVAGWKQSGVQFGAFLAGLPLAALASATDWRIAVGLTAVLASGAAVLTGAVAKDSAPPQIPALRVKRPQGDAAWMCGFSLFLGAGISAINTYTALYSSARLGLSPGAASALVAGLGVAGIAGRVGWTRRSATLRSPAILLAPLGFGSAVAAAVILAADPVGAWLVWPGVLGIGGFAVAANAVSMMTVIATAAPEHIGRDSALVSAGFFAGFVVGPSVFGMLAQYRGYPCAWSVVITEFLAATAVAWWWQRQTGPAR
ncbi:MFS transporter [Nocardia spumae]|uniref:MFS transporter n=1 Tax=Nocardia spumae TaxID=2887190 RepID=UPI001D13D561|nr:MFS transporter [Nocardia spumae]